jgi:hypothetical protein
VVGEIPRREAVRDMRVHAFERPRAIDAAVATRNLPHAVQEAADTEIASQIEAFQRHGVSLYHRRKVRGRRQGFTGFCDEGARSAPPRVAQ